MEACIAGWKEAWDEWDGWISTTSSVYIELVHENQEIKYNCIVLEHAWDLGFYSWAAPLIQN